MRGFTPAVVTECAASAIVMATPTHPSPRTNARPVVIDVVDRSSNDFDRQQQSALLEEALAENLPAPVQRGKGWRILLLVAGLIMAIVLGVVVLNIDREADSGDGNEVVKSFEHDIAPPPPGIDDATKVADINRDTGFVTTQRGWIQATDNGRLAQEYRYASSVPGPGGRVHMTRPEVKIYMKDRRVLTLRGETADVLAPNKALESGTMTGDVLIRLYEVAADRQLDESTDAPLLEVRTPEASFDNFQGDVICPGEVDIQTATAHLPAVGLRMQINDMEGRPGQLTIDRINGELRLAEMAQDQAKPGTTESSRDPKPERSANDAPKAAAKPERRETTAARSDPPARGREQRQLDRARERREMHFKQAAPIEKSQGPYFYRLTMTQDVRVRQGDGSVGWTATCDQMHMIFSLDNNDIGGSLSRGVEPEPVYGPMEPLRLEQALAALAIASTQEPSSGGGLFKPSDNDTIITCEGPLTMVPLKNAAEQPVSAEDTRFELIGSPVVLHNDRDATNVYCASLQYATLSEVMELIGSPQHGLVIDSPDLHAEGDRFWVDRLNNDGAFVGPGWMVAGESDPDNKSATQPALPLERREDVRIAWNAGVELEFEPASKDDGGERKPDPSDAHGSFGRLKLASFLGTVGVQSPDFTLDADRMDVGFPGRPVAAIAGKADDASKPASAQQLASIEFMHAEGGVKAGSMSDGGSIHCADLRVNFENHEGKTVPLNMLATGEVAAVDREKQTVWSDKLNVAFKPVAARTEVNGTQPATSQSKGKSDRRADVESLTATGGVQIQMADGARVFADRLEADGEGHMVVLTGEDVMVVSDRNIISKGKRLELAERGATVTWPGSGEFAYYTAPILTTVEANRIAKPVVDPAANPRQMLAKWNQSMVYDGTYANGAGSIIIRGNVDAQSTPSTLELNTMTGDQVTLLFAKAEVTAAQATTTTQPATAPASQPDGGGGLFAMEQSGRQLKELIAIGKAKLESRTWLNADHSDLPRVFSLSSDKVTYNDQTLEAMVDGKGELVVRDDRPEPASTQPAPKPAGSAGAADRRADLPFGAKGATLFRWSESLRMTRQSRESSMYDIVMLGRVQVIHRAIDKSVSTMTGERLDATVDRSQSSTDRDAGFDLGGSMDMKRIHAQGNVYVDSPKRDVDCDEFDYDYVTGIAQLNASPGRSVTVVTAGNAHPVQARSFLWNTIDDTVTVRNVSGTSGR